MYKQDHAYLMLDIRKCSNDSIENESMQPVCKEINEIDNWLTGKNINIRVIEDKIHYPSFREFSLRQNEITL